MLNKIVRRPSRRGVSRNAKRFEEASGKKGRPSRRGVSRNRRTRLYRLGNHHVAPPAGA